MQQRAYGLGEPLIPADFGYSGLGATAAVSLAFALVAALYAFTQWPLATAGWLAAAGVARMLGRHPIAALFR